MDGAPGDTVVLSASAANSYTGGTLIEDGGELDVSSGLALGSPSGTITFNSGTLGFLNNCIVSQPIFVSSGTTDYIDTYGNTVFIAGALTGSGTLDVIGGGKVIFGNPDGFAGLESRDGTPYYTSPAATYISNASAAASSLTGLVVVDGCTLTVTGTSTAAPAVLVVENGGEVTSSTAAIDSAIVSLTGGNSSLDANLGSGTTVLVQGSNYYQGTSAADIVLAQGADLYANALLTGVLSGLGNLHDWHGLTLQDNETQFVGNYDLDGGSYAFFLTSALSGQAGLNVANDTDVAFYGNGNVVYAFGNLSGEAYPIDLTYNGAGSGGYTLLINETGTTDVTGLIGDAGYNSTVVITGGGSLTWDVQGESGYPVYTLNVGSGTTVTFDDDTTANDFTIDGNVTNNGTLIANNSITVNGTLTNYGFVQCAALNVTGILYNYGTVVVAASVDNEGWAVFCSGGIATISGNGTFINESSGNLEVGSNVYYSGWLGPTDVTGQLNLQSSGTFINYGGVNIGGTLTITGAGSFANYSGMTIGGNFVMNGAAATFLNGSGGQFTIINPAAGGGEFDNDGADIESGVFTDVVDGTTSVSFGSATVNGELIFVLSANMTDSDAISGSGNIVIYNSDNYTVTFANISGAIANNVLYD